MALVVLAGYLAACLYTPWLVLLAVACAALLMLLSSLYSGSMWLLEKGAKALPSCWLWDGPAPASPPQKPRADIPHHVDWDWRHDTTDYPSGRR